MNGTTYPHAAGFVAGDRPQIVTARFQYDDSYTLDRFLATDGYKGLQAALAKSPVEVHDDVKGATVLGRGGAGFPAGVKWGLTPQAVWPRYLVVNGDESEPGTYKDRLLMELDPHQLIEGCLIACYAAGLSQCFLYIRGEMARVVDPIRGRQTIYRPAFAGIVALHRGEITEALSHVAAEPASFKPWHDSAWRPWYAGLNPSSARLK